MANITKVYDNQRKALNWLCDKCNDFHISPPDHIDTSGRRIRLGSRREFNTQGSPVYYATQTNSGNVFVTFHTFKGGEFKETFNTGGGNGEGVPQWTVQKNLGKRVAKDQKSVDRLKYAESLYDGASLTGVCAYLVNSMIAGGGNLQSFAHQVLGLRYLVDGIIIPLYDYARNITGYQTIRGEGGRDKKFYGTIKGSGIIIGDFTQALNAQNASPVFNSRNKLHIAEGLRTGLSIHASNGEPVLVALAAGNMEAAARPYMNAHVPIEAVKDQVTVGRNATLALRYNAIVIGADNDAVGKDGTKRELYQNTGLVFANRLANAAPPGVLCVVTSPKDGKDWYDVLRDKGIVETAADYKVGMGFVDYNYAFARKPQAWELVPGTRYLSKLNIKPGINLVRSPIGTGKTQALIELLAESSSYCISTHLQSLARNVAARLVGCKLYSDKGVDVANERYLSICLNSLPRLLENGVLKPYEYFILDEIEQFLQRLTTDVDNKKLILEALEWLIRNCEHVVMLDAQLGKLTKAFLSRLGFDIGTVNQITNNYRVGAGRTVKVYAGADGLKQVIEGGIAVVKSGGRSWVSCNSKKEAHKVYTYYAAATHKKGLYISADNSGDLENKAFFADVNGEQAKYDFIVTSPSTNTGVSIDSVDGFAAFDYVAYIGKTGINTHKDAVQGMGRVRDTKEIHVWLEAGSRDIPQTRECVAAPWDQAMLESGLCLSADGVLEMAPIQQRYAELVTDVTIARQHSHRNFRNSVLRELHSEGYNLVNMDSTRIWEKEEGAVELRKEMRELESKAYCARIENAPELSPQESEELERRHCRTMVETDAITKKELGEFYRVDIKSLGESELSDLVERDKRGRFQTCVLNAEQALKNSEEIDMQTRKQAESGKMAADMIPYQARNEYFQLLLLVLLPRLLAAKDGYTGTHEAIVEFLTMLKALSSNPIITSVVRITKALEANPMKFIGEQLRRVGLRQSSKQTTDGTRVYSIDTDAVDYLRSILEKRNPEKLEAIKGMLGYR